jgi:DNA-binding transcriptional ArsR family regulator
MSGVVTYLSRAREGFRCPRPEYNRAKPMGKQRRRETRPQEPLPYLRALGDSDRLKIVQALRDGPKSVGDICKELASPMANVSHHLHALKEVGVVSARKRGRFVIYALNHVAESREAGTHVFDFGCVRIEFGKGRATPSVRATRPEDDALQILNRMVSGVATAEKKTAAKAPVRRRKRATRTPARRERGKAIEIVNPSFELPTTPFFDTAVTGWQKEGDPSGTGVFRNFPDDTPIPGSRFVKNADGEQLATVAARTSAGLFQLLDGVAYSAGSTYTLSVGVGVSSVRPPAEDAGGVAPAFHLALTYTDAAGRRREVGGRRVTATDLRSDRLRAVSVGVPANRVPKQCIGWPIGILIAAEGGNTEHPGNFILDHVTLSTR